MFGSDNIFQDALNDASGLQERLLGPNYSYAEGIKTPSELGMSSKGTLKALGDDISGLTSYVQLLVEGGGKASKAGILGNRLFIKTGGKCTAPDGSQQDRYMYINNQPNGSIPIISSAMDVNFTSFRGLVPGILTDLEEFNPFKIMGAFMMGSAPDCQEITLETIDVHNTHSTETHYVATADLKDLNACTFQDRKNPITGNSCRETFGMMADDAEDPMIAAFYTLVGIGGIALLWKLMLKR